MNSLHTYNLPRCPECGGYVKLLQGIGRIREYRRGVKLDIPNSFEIPTCTNCGEEIMIPEVTDELDAILGKDYQFKQMSQINSSLMKRNKMNILYKSRNIKIGKYLIFAIAFPNKVPSFNFEIDLTFPNSYRDTEGGHFSFNIKFPYLIDFRFSIHRKA